MTTEDLILGHFDGTLTPQEESRLQAEMSASPAARSLYEQHRSLHMMLSSDAASLVPSARLDRSVVTAALGAVPETVGGGALSWLTAKVAVGLSAVVAGGVSIVMLNNSGPDTVAPAAPAPAVSTAPVPSQAPATLEMPKSDEVKVTEPAAAPPAAAKSDAPKNRTGARVAEQGTSATKAAGQKKPALRLDTSNKTNIDQGTKIVPENNK